jgi:hypothetical protein
MLLAAMSGNYQLPACCLIITCDRHMC